MGGLMQDGTQQKLTRETNFPPDLLPTNRIVGIIYSWLMPNLADIIWK